MSGDKYVELARKTIESYIRTGEVIDVPDGLPEEMLSTQAGAFVSLHRLGKLRGCIGTIQGVQPNIAQEIISNAISASTRDPRFRPVRADELDDLEISVDVLGAAERVGSLEDLDVKRYGVIVTKGFRRGLLLPDLEGVDTPGQQVAIALMKAGLSQDEEDFILERFEVIRHT